MMNNRAMDKNADAPWSQLHWLIVLAEQGSYTSAAARLGVSKASMSQHIAELERSVGQTLVRRSTRSMQLTEAGRLLVEETRGSFDKITQSFHNARDTDGEPRGLIRVTAPVALGRQHLVPRIVAEQRQLGGPIDLRQRLPERDHGRVEIGRCRERMSERREGARRHWKGCKPAGRRVPRSVNVEA